jgi:hypothetical protein
VHPSRDRQMGAVSERRGTSRGGARSRSSAQPTCRTHT